MMFRAVQDRCAVDVKSMDWPVDIDTALGILQKRGIRKINVDLIAVAEGLVGKAGWKLPSPQSDAPHHFDCSSLTKWIYGRRGILIPRRPAQQFEFCRDHGQLLGRDELLAPGDLVFLTSPFVNGKRTDEHNGIGHVCLMAEDGDVICATNSEFGTGVVKIPFHQLFATRKSCGAGRIIPRGAEVITLEIPLAREAESSDDIRWIVLQSLRPGA